MRVLHVTDSYLPVLGGIEVLVHDLAAHQRLDGHQVQVLTRTRGTGVDDDHTIRRPGAVCADLGELVRRARPDVVHCHSSIVSPLAWRTARQATRAGLPVLITMHSIVPGRPFLQAGLRQVARAMPRTVAWSAVSAIAASLLQPIVGADVRVLPNGIDRAACRIARPGRNDPPVIVSVMRLSRRKRALELIEVLAQVRARLEELPWQAVIVGDGPLEAAVARAVRRAGLSDRVRLTGRLSRPQIMRLLARTDVYLAPAHLESFGIAALEARCSGLPVVAMRSGGVAEFVQDGVHGYLVGDDAEMGRRTAQLLGDRNLVRRLADLSLSDPPDLDWTRIVERSLAAYREAGADSDTSLARPLTAPSRSARP